MQNPKPNRVRAFVGPSAEQRAERAGHWLKALIGNEKSIDWCRIHRIALQKAQAEGVDSLGGYLVPEDFDAAILNVRETVGAFRIGADVQPMRSATQVRPRRIGGLTANFVDEGAAIPESSFTLDVVGVSARKLAVLARSSVELFEDSEPDLAEFVASEIGYAFAAKTDDIGFNADGSNTYAGMTGLATKLNGMKSAVPAATGHDTFAEIDATDIANLIGGVLATALPGAAFYISATGYALTICRLAATGGLVATAREDGTIQANYLGFPVLFSSKLPDVATSLTGKPMMYFGNLAMAAVLAERRGLTVATSLHRALENDQILVRGTERGGIVVHTVGDANTHGPIAALIGSS